MAIKRIIVLFVETPRKFITAKLSIRKPGLRIESFAVINYVMFPQTKLFYAICYEVAISDINFKPYMLSKKYLLSNSVIFIHIT